MPYAALRAVSRGRQAVPQQRGGRRSGNADRRWAGQQASNAWSIEVGLDTQWAHTIAPDANIVLVTTPTAETQGVPGLPNMMHAEQYVVDHHLADVVTQSFGTSEEAFGSTASLLNLRHAFVSGTQAGMTFFASTGDFGTANPRKQPVGRGGSVIPYPTVQWPASDPLVVAAGGTNLCTNPLTGTGVDSSDPPSVCQNNPGMREVGWTGSGGGFSHVFAKPSWQDSLPAGSTAIGSMRGVPDVSWDASCGTLVWVLDTAPGFNHWYGVCGTSAASPQLAAMTRSPASAPRTPRPSSPRSRPGNPGNSHLNFLDGCRLA